MYPQPVHSTPDSDRNSSSPTGQEAGYGQSRQLSRRVVLLIAAIAVWSFSSDLLTILSERDGAELDQALVLDVVSVAALTLGVLVTAMRSAIGTVVILIGALLHILQDPPLLAVVVLLINTLLVAYTGGKRLARAQVLLATGWVVLHVVLVPGNQWILWGFIPCLLGLHVLGMHLARLRDDNLELQERARQNRHEQRRAIEAERREIARDLHDIVAHDMTLVAMQSDAARISGDPEKVRMFLDAISDASHQSLHDLRVIMRVLLPPSDDPVQREATPVSNQSLQREIEDTARRLTDLGFDVQISIDGELDQLYRAVQVALVPVIRECATNIAKHTDAEGRRFVTIRISMAEGPLALSVTSGPVNGVHPTHKVPSARFGLLCLAERMDVMGGTFQSGPVGNRWVVEATLPQSGVSRR